MPKMLRPATYSASCLALFLGEKVSVTVGRVPIIVVGSRLDSAVWSSAAHSLTLWREALRPESFRASFIKFIQPLVNTVVKSTKVLVTPKVKR